MRERAAKARQRAVVLRRRVFAPSLQARASVALGVVVVVVSVGSWQPVLGGIILGVALVVRGLLFIDLDSDQQRRR